MKLKTLVLAALFVIGLCSMASAQTLLASTTLAAALDGSQRNVSLTSATGVTAPGNGNTQVVLLVDRELMKVLSITGTVAYVQRGTDGTRAQSHINTAPVWVAPPAAISSYMPAGQCVRTNLLYVPYIVGAGPGLGQEVGTIFDCLGLTVNGQWVQTNGNGAPTLGATIASPNGLLTPSATYFKVSGTNAITGIVAPAGIGVGFTIAIEPTGAFTWTLATNITVAGTAVVGKVLYFTWNGAKWAPSYIA